MSANLINDVWDDTELVKLYEESTKQISEALISRANLVIPKDSKQAGSDGELDEASQSDKEDGEMDEGEILDEDQEEGEIREKNGQKRSLDNLEDNEDGEEEGEEEAEVDEEVSAKKLKTVEEEEPELVTFSAEVSLPSDDSSQQLQHPSQVAESLIEQNFATAQPELKRTINASLGAYFQAGYHARSLESCLGLEKGSLQVPMNSLAPNSANISDKLNSALLSYWQMGYYNSLCQTSLQPEADKD